MITTVSQLLSIISYGVGRRSAPSRVVDCQQESRELLKLEVTGEVLMGTG